MKSTTAELNIELTPRARVDVIDVSKEVTDQFGDVLRPYPKALYCSYHTTAGYFAQHLSARLNHDPDTLQTYLQAFQQLFPPNANYQHDQLDLRSELSDEQRRYEPRNADSHLTFMGSGLENCVAYDNEPDVPVYFVELDGVNGPTRRRRRSKVIGFHEEVEVARETFSIPLSNHPIDSVNLRDPRLGLFEALQQHVHDFEIDKGWIELSLHPEEGHTGLTVNEYETLLMKHDLVEVLKNPIRFMTETGKSMIRDPRAIPHKARNYAKYDLVRLINQALDVLGLSESVIERLIDRLVAVPASRFLGMRRSTRLLISDEEGTGAGSIVHGQYQSPILVQWQRNGTRSRRIEATFVRFV